MESALATLSRGQTRGVTRRVAPPNNQAGSMKIWLISLGAKNRSGGPQ